MTEENLPSQLDFDPWGGDLDAQCAWKRFGGLSLKAACERFAEIPEVYQEDFMFMGPRAFAFYFPALDTFLRATPAIKEDCDNDRQSWIISQCIQNQFTMDGDTTCLRDCHDAALSLCDFVLSNLNLFEQDWDPPGEICKKWAELKDTLLNWSP